MSSSSPAALPAPHTEETQFHRDVLNELVAMGMDIARTLHRHAKSQPESGTPNPGLTPAFTMDLSIPFERIARTVRRTIRLAQHIAQPIAQHGPTRAVPSPSPSQAERQVQARKQILRAVEDTIIRTRRGPAAATAHAELLDRLDSPELADDLDRDIATRPVAEIIAEITRDLGLLCDPGSPYYRRRTPADVHRLTRRANGHRIPEPSQAEPWQAGPSQAGPSQIEPPQVRSPPPQPAPTRPGGPEPAPFLPPLKPPPSLALLAAKLLDT